MCTAFVRNGADYIAGFNFDVDPAVWDYKLFKTDKIFYIGIKAGNTTYRIHGVNALGYYGVLPYMNGPEENKYHRGKKYQRIDLLNDKWISGQLTYNELLEILQSKELINVPGCSLHALFADRNCHMILAEPGEGHRLHESKRAVVTNYPLLNPPEDLLNPFYGADRFKCAEKFLNHSDDDFSAADGLTLLKAVKQEGQWATRISFVYSGNENTVHYCIDGDFNNIMHHSFSYEYWGTCGGESE